MRCLLACLVVLTATLAAAQEPPKNPTLLLFTCPDHDRDTDHEVDIVRVSDGMVVQTIRVGDPPVDAAGDVRVTLNVMPVAFDTYVVVVRAIFEAISSPNSAPSNPWQRVPGKPGVPRVP